MQKLRIQWLASLIVGLVLLLLMPAGISAQSTDMTGVMAELNEGRSVPLESKPWWPSTVPSVAVSAARPPSERRRGSENVMDA